MEVYFAIETLNAQATPYSLLYVGTYLDYYVVKVPYNGFVHMHMDKIDPIPLSKFESECVWFAGATQPFVKIEKDSWEDFGRELKDEYEISLKGKIIYPYTEEEDRAAASLMKKIISRKVRCLVDNLKKFDMYGEYFEQLNMSLMTQLDQSSTIAEVNSVYYDIQLLMYESIGGDKNDIQRPAES